LQPVPSRSWNSRVNPPHSGETSMRHALAVIALGLFTAPLLTTSLSAQTIVYLNFDEQEDAEQLMDDGGLLVPTFTNRDPYTPGSTEVGPDLPPPYDNLNIRFEYKSTLFAGPAFGPTP